MQGVLTFDNQLMLFITSTSERKKNHMITTIDAEKAPDKIQYSFMIQMLIKLGIEGNFLKLIKNHLQKPAANIILNDEKLETFPLRSGKRQRSPFTTPFQHHTGNAS